MDIVLAALTEAPRYAYFDAALESVPLPIF
jgi:hypothetical protein